MVKYISIKNIIILALAIVVLYLLTCNKKPVPSLPIVKTVSEQKQAVRVDSVASKSFVDSVNAIISRLQSEAKVDDKNIQELMDANTDLQLNMDAFITQAVPDSCLEYQAKVIALNKQISQVNAAAQKNCAATINTRNLIISQKDALLVNARKDYSKLRASLDTCFKQQATLTKALKDFKPKRSVGVGIMTEAGWTNPYKFDAGAFIYYRGKNGTQFSVGALTSQRIQLTYSKSLFKF